LLRGLFKPSLRRQKLKHDGIRHVNIYHFLQRAKEQGRAGVITIVGANEIKLHIMVTASGKVLWNGIPVVRLRVVGGGRRIGKLRFNAFSVRECVEVSTKQVSKCIGRVKHISSDIA
jgi:hypothetical protein